MKSTMFFCLIVLIIFCLSYICWKADKFLSYSIGYEKMVKETIREMVKPEALKE